MSVDNEQTPNSITSEIGGKSNALSRVVCLLIAVVILVAAAGISIYWLTHRPKAKRSRPESQAILVQVSRVKPQTHTVTVLAMGTVTPARSIQLQTQVSGQVVQVSPEFMPGGRFKAGERILQVEPKDYQLVVQQRASDLAKAQCDLKVEMGQQSVAKQEYKLLGQKVKAEDMELLLRVPQLAMARAAVSAAQASLEQARLDLKRTSVAAPFNAMVQSRGVNLGSQVNSGTTLASLVGTDRYWVEVSIPVDELKWISVPSRDSKEGSPVRVYYESAWGPKAFRHGVVERLMANLETQGRMARLLVAVDDPLELKSSSRDRHQLILDSYVRVEIQGRGLANVIRVPRTALRDGNRVWVMQPDNTLDIRTVKVVWSGNEHVYVTDGLGEGDQLVTSDLAAPVQGMALRTAELPQKHSQSHPASEPATRKRPEAKQ